ncbi:hypothetical protein Tco_0513427 [Tanacetum coccineum]
MVESSNLTQIPSSPDVTPKEEPITLDRLESLNSFLPADQVEFSFEEIALTTNNEVALLYPSLSSTEYFKVVSDFISKCCLKEAFTKSPTRYNEYLCEFCREIGAKGTLKKSFLPPRWRLLMAQIIQCLGGKTGGHDQISNKDVIILYCLANGVEVDYAKLIWEDALKPNQHEGPPFTNHIKAIYNIDVHVDSQAPTTSSQTKKVPQGKKLGAKSGLRRKQSSKHTSESQTEASKSKTGQSDKETQSSLVKDKNISHPSPSTPVVGEMHKETQQAAGGPTSLGATSKEGAHPQLNSGSDVWKTLQLKLILEFLLLMNPYLKNRLEDLLDLMKDTRSAFFTPDSLQDEPIIVSDESEEEETKKDKDTHTAFHDVPEDTSVLHPPSPKSTQIQELMAQGMEIELPGDLNDLPTKLETFTSNISSLMSQVAELKMLKWELPAEFASIMENASKGVPLAGLTTALPDEGEKNTNPAIKDADTTNLHKD